MTKKTLKDTFLQHPVDYTLRPRNHVCNAYIWRVESDVGMYVGSKTIWLSDTLISYTILTVNKYKIPSNISV